MESVIPIQEERAVHRFVPRRGGAAAERVAASLAGAVLAFAFFHFVREVEPALNLGLSLASGLLVHLFYTLRARVVGLHAVEITPEGLTAEGRKEKRSVRWDDVEDARHTYFGGDRWSLRTGDGASLDLVLDGYTPEEASHINALIRARVGARGECGGGKSRCD